MSAGSLAKLTPVSVVELEDPQGGDAPAHGELQHQESGMERNYSYTSLTGVASLNGGDPVVIFVRDLTGRGSRQERSQPDRASPGSTIHGAAHRRPTRLAEGPRRRPTAFGRTG